jgi:D-sedoheptulose 7-phosphate isomerase
MTFSFVDYYAGLIELLRLDDGAVERLEIASSQIMECGKRGNKVIIVGNGGSAAIASHFSVDLTKNASIRAINFNESDLITCFANDFGYEYWVLEAIKAYADKGDLVILISSSGKSMNMVNAAQFCVGGKHQLITFSGMDDGNPLMRANCGGINFWVNSTAYNYIENVHQIQLLSIVDRCIGRAVYSAKK